MFGLVAWNNTAATANTENTLSSVLDPDITTQNSNFIFTGPYRLLAEVAVGASVNYGRYSVAEWNGRGRPNIFAVNRNANPTAPLFFTKYHSKPLPLPMNQQIQPYLTNSLASGTESETLLWRIATNDWSANEPPGVYDFIGHATATVTGVAGSWVLSQTISFDLLPLGGVYVVLGAQCIGANGMAFRLNFPRTRMYLGRRLRPGGPIFATFGSLPPLFFNDDFSESGVWGAFHTFELPTLDILSTGSASKTYDIFMKLRFLGEPVTLLDQFVSTAY